MVAVVERQGETYNVLGDRRLQGLQWLRGVGRLVHVLGDLRLQGLLFLRGVERLIRVLGDGCRGCGDCKE